MGLDIYFRKIHNVDAYNKMRKAEEDIDTLEENYYKNNKEYIDECNKKWNEWYDGGCDERTKPSCDDFDRLTDTERTTRDNLLMDKSRLESEAGLEADIDSLYMRKINWMVAYVQSRHPECLEDDERFGKVLKYSYVVLDVDDIEELVRRMSIILSNYSEYSGKSNDEMGYVTNEYKDYYDNLMSQKRNDAETLLPTMSRFLFGSTEYDWYYYTTMHAYYEEFKRILDEMKRDGCSLEYMESW